MPSKKFQELVNGILPLIVPTVSDRFLIDRVNELVSYIDNTYQADPMSLDDIEICRNTYKLLKYSPIEFRGDMGEYNKIDLCEVVNQLDDRLESHEMSYGILDTLDETLKLKN